jgi:small conductance mechanosensitive channel
MNSASNVITNIYVLAQRVEEQAVTYVPLIGSGLFVFLVLWACALVSGALIARVARRVGDGRKDVFELLANVARIGLTTAAVLCGLGTAGIDVMPLVAGLGLMGFSLGFAFKDALSNILSGMLIILYRPFARGDHITVAGCEGTVANIDLRYTTLSNGTQTFLVPNTTMFTTTITIHHRDG